MAKNKKPPGESGFLYVVWEIKPASFSLDRDAHGLCFVSQCHHLAAGLAELILGHSHAVASGAAVGVNSEAMLADAAHFGAEVAHSHFFGFALGQGLTRLQGGENTESLGFGIDKFHCFFLSRNNCAFAVCV